MVGILLWGESRGVKEIVQMLLRLSFWKIISGVLSFMVVVLEAFLPYLSG